MAIRALDLVGKLLGGQRGKTIIGVRFEKAILLFYNSLARYDSKSFSVFSAAYLYTKLDVYDVFLLDSDFKIERPKRYYRLLAAYQRDQEGGEDKDATHVIEGSIMGSIRTRMSHFLHIGSETERKANGHAITGADGDIESISSGESSTPSIHAAPMLDPSTNVNPLSEGEDMNNLMIAATKKRGKRVDVSKHTFYIENSQSRLKLFARNEVCREAWCSLRNRLSDRFF